MRAEALYFLKRKEEGGKWKEDRQKGPNHKPFLDEPSGEAERNINHEPLKIKSYEKGKLEDSYSDYRVDTDSSADRVGNDLVHGMHVR